MGLISPPERKDASRPSRSIVMQAAEDQAATSILQALSLVNGSLVANRTSVELNATLGVLAEQSTSHGCRVESLYLMVLSRKPTVAESQRIVAYLEGGGVGGDGREALADVFWALFNSPEFFLDQ